MPWGMAALFALGSLAALGWYGARPPRHTRREKWTYGAAAVGCWLALFVWANSGALDNPGRPEPLPFASAEFVEVKYRGLVNVAGLGCSDVARSSFVERVCFDPGRGEMIIRLSGAYYAYCGIPESVVDELLEAESAGRFYNAEIKGQYACR